METLLKYYLVVFGCVLIAFGTQSISVGLGVFCCIAALVYEKD